MQTLEELSVKYQLEESLPVAKELKITTQEEYTQVSDYMVAYRKLIKKIKEKFAPIKKKTDEAHKEAIRWEKEELAIAEPNEKLASDLLIAWRQKQEDERLAEQARQNAEIKRMAEKEQTDLLARAAELEAQGATIEAAGALEAATQVKAPEYTLASTTEKTERTVSGTTSWIPDWTVEVLDPLQVILAICGGVLPPDCIEVKDGRVKAWAKAHNVASGEYHGCKITRTERPQVR